MPDNDPRDNALNTLSLVAITLVCVIAILVTHQLTRERITANKERTELAIVSEVITSEYDNNLLTDKLDVAVPAAINPAGSLTAYRARKNRQPVAVSLMPIVTQGYSGNISLVVGINYDGSLSGIKVRQHNETEGFGARIHQDQSDWLLTFNQRGLKTPKEQWAVKKDGGDFDQLSGATITSRRLINVIYETLKYYSRHRDLLYDTQ